jgi:ActR/RegA family two-component response regulator
MRTIVPNTNPHLSAGNSAENIRVLVVDDEPAILFAYRKLIEKDGISVDISATLEDAIRQIRIHPYLAVIADMRLAGTDNEDGLEILRFIRKVRPETKTIFATGYGDIEIEKTALALGASHYFKKPVSPSDILKALHEFHIDTAGLTVV